MRGISHYSPAPQGSTVKAYVLELDRERVWGEVNAKIEDGR